MKKRMKKEMTEGGMRQEGMKEVKSFSFSFLKNENDVEDTKGLLRKNENRKLLSRMRGDESNEATSIRKET